MMTARHRRAKEKLQRIQQIQAAARSIFFRKEYQSSTIDEIANLAEVSKGTVYLYFHSKDELYVSLMIPVIEQLCRLLTKFEKELLDNVYEDCESLLKGLFELFMKLNDFDPEGLRIYQNFQLNFLYSLMSKDTQKRLAQLGKNNFTLFRKIIAKANQLGLLQEADPIRLSDVMWGLFLGVTQIEGSKFQLSRKDHLAGTLEYAVTALSKGLSVN